MKTGKLFFTLLAILAPILIITTGMRVALSPLYYSLEYRLPNFPPDPYGFTRADRLRWADFSIDFISGRIGEAEFAAAQLPDGSPLFNQREVDHMVDVRDLTSAMLWVWRGLVLLYLLAFSFTRSKQQEISFLASLANGAKLTLALIVAVLFFLVINFNQLFTAFHRVFFEGDTWLFYNTDTLIRLFPLKFWQDLFIVIGAFSILLALFFIYLHHLRKNIAENGN